MILRIFTIFLLNLEINGFAAVVNPEDSVELYACNIGLSQGVGGGNQCHTLDGNVCTTPSTNCICTNGQLGVSTAYSSYSDNLGVVTHRALVVGPGQSTNLFTEIDSWNYKFIDLSFGLSSELYGSDYQVTFCYLGPEKTTGTGSLDLSEGNYAFSVGIMNQRNDVNIANYLNEAGLALSAEVICDLRGVGLKTTSRSRKNGETTPQSIIERDFIWTGLAGLSSSSLNILGDINLVQSQVPRFCIVNLLFRETNKTIRRANPNLILSLTTDLSIYKK